MAESRKLLSIILAFTLLFSTIFTSVISVYAEQANGNLEGVREIYGALLEDLQIPVIVSDVQEEPQSVTDSVYLKNAVPIKPEKQKEILIKYKDLNMAANIRSKTKDDLHLSKLHLKNRVTHLKLELVEIDDCDDINKVLNKLNNDKSIQYAQPNYMLTPNSIQYAQPNYMLTPNSIPSDLLFNEQWALQNVGQAVYGQAGVAGIDIDAVNAWSVTEGNSDIIVGIVDTGIDITHCDISDSVYFNPDEIAGNGIDDDNNGYIDDISGWDFFNQDNSVFD